MSKSKRQTTPDDLDDLDPQASVGDLAAKREQLAVERAKLREEEKESIRVAAENLGKLKALQADMESRGAVLDRFRAEDGPEVKEIHFLKTFSLPGTGIRDEKRVILDKYPETHRPRVVDMAKERKLLIMAPGAGSDVHVVMYEGLTRLVYGPMGS